MDKRRYILATRVNTANFERDTRVREFDTENEKRDMHCWECVFVLGLDELERTLGGRAAAQEEGVAGRVLLGLFHAFMSVSDAAFYRWWLVLLRFESSFELVEFVNLVLSALLLEAFTQFIDLVFYGIGVYERSFLLGRRWR